MPVANKLILYLEARTHHFQKFFFSSVLLIIDDRGIYMSILSDGYSMLQNLLNQLHALELHSRVLLKLKIRINRA